MKVLAIDPGCTESAYVVLDQDYKLCGFGKVSNDMMMSYINNMDYQEMAVEMVASYGMPVGVEVFETVFWIGRFWEASLSPKRTKVYRKDVKLNICGTLKANDANIGQALRDRFGQKGTKALPGFFYGFKADVWSAFAVGCTYLDLRGEKNER